MCPVVVVDDVSPVVRTGYVDRIRNRSSGVVGVPKAQNSVFFVGCVRDVDRKPKKVWVVSVEFVWNETCSLKYKIRVCEKYNYATNQHIRGEINEYIRCI